MRGSTALSCCCLRSHGPQGPSHDENSVPAWACRPAASRLLARPDVDSRAGVPVGALSPLCASSEARGTFWISQVGSRGKSPACPSGHVPRSFAVSPLPGPFLNVVPWGPRGLSEGLALVPAGDLRCGDLQTLHPEDEISKAPSQLDVTLRFVL